MCYNLKNQNIAIIAVVFAVMMSFSHIAYAQVEAVPENSENAALQSQNNAANDDDLFGLDENNEETPDKTANSTPAADENPSAEEAPSVKSDAAQPQNADEANASTNDQLNLNSIPDTSTSEGQKELEEAVNAADAEMQNVVEAPKSPFESFGNAILSKVDNSLFNQMSNIEKQTTILNLEYKREEVRNRIEALRIQRLKAREEEATRKKEEEERLKNEETQRKIKEVEAQKKLKEAEAELEKVRQARVLNEYMNEMLIVNQKWVEKNAALQNQVKKLRDERRSLIKVFEDKMQSVKREAASTVQKTQNAKSAHDRTITSLQTQIISLKKAIVQNEDMISQMKNGNSSNPFAEGIDENAIDMSDEYAIMDITGKGKDIIAKIVSKDGTTFIVHKGSMLKGGEVVMAITNNYVAFDNKGVKSYLYTGGTVREYEPETSFNGADKTPVAGKEVVNNNAAVRNVRGASVDTKAAAGNKTPQPSAPAACSKTNPQPVKRTVRTGSPANVSSLGQGMFVK